MKHQMQLCAFVTLATVAMVCGKHSYLTEKPDIIKTCRLSDPSRDICFAKSFALLFTEWKNGVPGLKSVGGLDPLYVKRISATQVDNNPLVNFKVNLLNVKAVGISQVEIIDTKLDFPNGIITAKLRAPKLELESDYDVKGRLLNLPLDGSGKGRASVNNFIMNLKMHLKLRDEFGYTFADVDKLRMDISDVGGFRLDLENLFNGQRDLEESTNSIINQNWRDFYAILNPAITEAIQAIMFDRVRKVFSFIPTNYFLEDIPTAAEHYG